MFRRPALEGPAGGRSWSGRWSGPEAGRTYNRSTAQGGRRGDEYCIALPLTDPTPPLSPAPPLALVPRQRWRRQIHPSPIRSTLSPKPRCQSPLPACNRCVRRETGCFDDDGRQRRRTKGVPSHGLTSLPPNDNDLPPVMPPSPPSASMSRPCRPRILPDRSGSTLTRSRSTSLPRRPSCYGRVSCRALSSRPTSQPSSARPT
jgi:hypothetical protein